jgi:hypothetical protein
MSKKLYIKPVLKKIGKVSNITLKTGSLSDFGGNKYRP